MENIKKNSTGDVEKKIPTTVRLSKSAYSELCKLSEEYDRPFGEIVRIAVELEYKKYRSSIRYIDRKQASEILADILELTAVCKEILNNIRRIGISYNQELHLKNAEKMFHDVLKNKNASADQRIAAKDIYDKETAKNQGTCLNRDELKSILEQFEAAAEKAEVLSWHIHE